MGTDTKSPQPKKRASYSYGKDMTAFLAHLTFYIKFHDDDC